MWWKWCIQETSSYKPDDVWHKAGGNGVVFLSTRRATGSFPGGAVVKTPPAVQKWRWVQSLGQEDPLEKAMATHSSILAWRIQWTEEPGGLQSIGLQRVRHDWATEHAHMSKGTTKALLDCDPLWQISLGAGTAKESDACDLLSQNPSLFTQLATRCTLVSTPSKWQKPEKILLLVTKTSSHNIRQK